VARRSNPAARIAVLGSVPRSGRTSSGRRSIRRGCPDLLASPSPDDRHPVAIDLDRQGGGRAVRARIDANRSFAARACRTSSALRLVVRVLRLAQPLDAELRGRRAHAARSGVRLGWLLLLVA
jgi:hypothetical protein